MPKITAPVQKFLVNRGDHVKQGQLLAVLENRDLTAAGRREPRRSWTRRKPTCAPPHGAPVPEVGGQGADRRGCRQADRRKPPRSCWTAASNSSRKARWPRKLVDDAQVAYAQANSAARWPRRSTCARCRRSARRSRSRPRPAQVAVARKAHLQSAEAQVSYSRDPQPHRPAWSPTGRSTPAIWPRPARRCSPSWISRAWWRASTFRRAEAASVQVGQPADDHAGR